MANRIREVRVVDRKLSPPEAELWIFVEAESVGPSTEVRGRLMGPSCPYANTVEAAYPLRPFPQLPEGFSPLTRRVVIPEPSLWDPVSPFMYQGIVELWENGELCDRAAVRHGLRSAQLGPRGLHWNGELLRLRAVEREQLAADEMAELRGAGVNTVLTPPDPAVFAEAERIGMLVLARPTMMPIASPACLGWVAWFSAFPDRPGIEFLAMAQRLHQFVGVELEGLALSLPPEIQFLVGPDTLLPHPGRPRLLRSVFEQAAADAELGWLDESMR
jgi:hypothetical protein